MRTLLLIPALIISAATYGQTVPPPPALRHTYINGQDLELWHDHAITVTSGPFALTTSGTGGPATWDGATLNIPVYTGGTADSFTWCTRLWRQKAIDSVLGVAAAHYYPLTNPSGYIALTDISSAITGISYSSATGVLSITTGYVIPTTTEESNWNTAYTSRITSLTTGGSSGAASLVANVLNIPAYSLTGLGGAPASRMLTINGTGYDMSADRTWSVGTVTSARVVSNAGAYSFSPTSAITSAGTYSMMPTGTSSQFVKGDGTFDNSAYLTANQSITLSGAVTGSGTTAIATTLAAGIVGTANLSATGTPSATKFLRGDNTWATPAGGGGSPGGSSGMLQWNNSGSFDGAGGAGIGSADGLMYLTTSSYATAVAAPTSGNVKLYGNSINGQDELWTANSAGTDLPLQTATGMHQWGLFTCNGSASQTLGFFTSAINFNGSGSFNLRSYDATNLAPNLLYYKLTGTASMNISVELYYAYTGRDAMIGNAAYGAGSKLVIDCLLPSYLGTQRFFAGYAATTGQITTLNDPSTQANIIGVGKDAADATLQFMFNNGSGTATKINTGITPTANDEYIITVTLPSVTTSSTVTIERRTKTASTKATATNSAKLPAAGTLMYWHAMSNSASVTTAPILGIKQVYEELYN